MSLSDLLRSRRRQTLAVGQTTRENRVLPAPEVLSQIPERSGAALPRRRRSVGARGFIALKPGNTLAVRFNPYTLAILDPAYEIAGAGYGSAGTKTPWNVPASDTTQWHDTLSFWDSKIYVNAAEMTMLGIAPASVPFSAVPYLIPSLTNPGEPYGNAGENATKKRVFAIGRYSVKSWAFGGTVETLTPTTPRTANKAMTIGQRGESNAANFAARTGSTVDKAWLGQLYFTGAAWDSAGGAWQFSQAEVTMMLGPPYLARVNSSATVDLTTATLGNAGNSTGSNSTPEQLPATAVGLYGNGVVVSYAIYGLYPTSGYTQFPWGGTIQRNLDGEVISNYSIDTWSGSAAAVSTQAGVSLTYAASNIKTWNSHTDTKRIKAQTVPYGATTASLSYARCLTTDNATLTWEPTPWTPGNLTAGRGLASRSLVQTSISGASAARMDEHQNGSFSVRTPAVVLVDLAFSQSKASGNGISLAPDNSYYSGYLADPWGLVGSGSGMGIYSSVNVNTYNLDYFKNPTGYRSNMAPAVIAEINAECAAMSNAYAAQIMYDDETSSGLNHTNYYTATTPALNTLSASLTWSTRDYLLYDEPNGVFIWLAGEFSGSQSAAGNGTATLTVTLWILTPHALVTKQLAAISPTGLDLLPEKLIAPGKYAVPSPQIRAIFAPLYQEQGAFKGAHYTSAAEESAGATPAHFFNCLLSLRTYAGLGTLNADNEGNTAVAFVPCNLLEMLHGFWWSTEYGVAASGDRYPIQYATRYSDLITALFTTPFAIAVRNGAEVDWTPTVNAAGAGLYRT